MEVVFAAQLGAFELTISGFVDIQTMWKGKDKPSNAETKVEKS